ncbi:hypothetical protein LTR10_022782 [Elasticomyces elasticus]|uniref:Metallo-beta-lactamase domain-containing protein n=1 Tax=Exophiala sideris TaxID=1016849 RepID=A0ABR0JNF9_9EURO|nr:hypothetical protein LTR10_022782 [Elasticomyces elasticus]KAK5036591.1 hypothetical protein LTS07_002318 [Exophiala sideris]KAK5041578.1 hypothetical protein LTR13_002245 [Exophiala sideris]KAK5066974.1 hypothetical protein LTR69_002322 [Exophiala sideris]KAK5185033.1 hypothetical protein LTR44_002879 [Eurotiomycetes sp. CCFEE 6388]
MSTSTITFPPSESAVRVRMIDPGAIMTVKAESFVKPGQKGHEIMNLTCTAYLIEHESSGKKVMFDLGVRKDYWNLSPVIHKRLGSVIPGLKVDTDVPEILKENDISLDSISSVIWSHYHWDHVGDMSLFPHSTEIVIGAGFKDSPVGPGYPEKEDSPLCSSDFKGRHLNVTDFTKSGLEIGGFGAHDFFGDGSFYLLGNNAPGAHSCTWSKRTD